MFSVNWIQHAVGHGGFHSGHLSFYGDPIFHWIFDCGSRRTEKFNAYLRLWTDHHQRPIDWLFISHFDTDHVSGVDTLMTNAVVRDVMVPYVNERELAFALLDEISRGDLTRGLVELVADPAAYFLSRGAERVTFLRGRDRERGEPIPLEPDPSKEMPSWTTKISPTPRRLAAPSWSRAGPAGSPQVQMIDGGACHIDFTRGQVGLRLKPYCAPIQPRQHRGLIKALQTKVGTIPWKTTRPGLGDLAYAIAHVARTAIGRADLRNIFKKFAGSSNRSSLSLASIPIVSDVSDTRWDVALPFGTQFGSGEVAWLNTGDAELLAPADLDDWKNTYATELKSVRVLALPHHGSDKNSNAAFQQLCPKAILAAHVKSDARKHPGVRVAQAAGRRLACVTEQPGSQVRMVFHNF